MKHAASVRSEPGSNSHFEFNLANKRPLYEDIVVGNQLIGSQRLLLLKNVCTLSNFQRAQDKKNLAGKISSLLSQTCNITYLQRLSRKIYYIFSWIGYLKELLLCTAWVITCPYGIHSDEDITTILFGIKIKND